MRGIGFTSKLLLAIAITVAGALGIAFGAVHRGTESDLEGRLDDDLRARTAQIEVRMAGAMTADEALADARAAVAGGTFGRTSQLVAVTVPGAGVATNQPELLGRPSSAEDDESEHEGVEEELEEADQVLAAPSGFSELTLDEAGEVRLLTTGFETVPGGPTAEIRVGEPTASIERALSGLSKTFLLVGFATLLIALVAGAVIASRLTAPLRRMAADSEQIDADVTQRVEVPGAHDEVRQLAEAFNRTLERLQGVFGGQKRFVADASHELRTPLTVIRGQLEVLSRAPDPGPAEVERVTDLVTIEVDRMERMVEDMLALAKGERTEAVHRRKVDLTPVAAESFESLSVTAERDFQVAAAPGVQAVADPQQISQLVRILTRNAIEHTEVGGWIRLSLERRDGSAAIVIEDDGPGIPEGEREQVLERFHRSGDSSPRHRGAGLGLAIAKAITDSHQGSLAIDSSVRGGVRVTVLIPS